MTIKRTSVLVGLAAALSAGAIAGCSSDSTAEMSTAGTGGLPASAAGASGAGVSGGGSSGAASGGAPAGGATTAAGGSSGSAAGGAASGGAGASSAGAGGSAAGASGATAGAGGATAGAGGAAVGGSAGAGGGAITFAAVSAIITKSCATNGCHDGSNTRINFKSNLYSGLTTPLPTGTDRCVGSILVVANNTAGSFLLNSIKTGGACQKGGGTIGRMPDNCSAAANAPRPCLSDAQVQTITAWISGGAPM